MIVHGQEVIPTRWYYRFLHGTLLPKGEPARVLDVRYGFNGMRGEPDEPDTTTPLCGPAK